MVLFLQYPILIFITTDQNALFCEHFVFVSWSIILLPLPGYIIDLVTKSFMES